MTKEKIAELRERMMKHGTVPVSVLLPSPIPGAAGRTELDIAVVVVTAKELDDLLNCAEAALKE